MQYALTGDFYFDTTNIKSTKGFSVVLHIAVPGLNREQHLYIREKLQKKLGMRAHSIPTPWGKGPVNYETLNFEIEDPQLCKHLISLLKAGSVELKAAGRRYPPDSDHPLFAELPVPKELPADLVSFFSLNLLIEQTISEAHKNFTPSTPGSEQNILAPRP